MVGEDDGPQRYPGMWTPSPCTLEGASLSYVTDLRTTRGYQLSGLQRVQKMGPLSLTRVASGKSANPKVA